jgi:PAS domain S-box-containing protein
MSKVRNSTTGFAQNGEREGERRHSGRNESQSDERFRTTFERAAVGIAQVATDGRWLRVNQKLCDIVGYSPDELMTRSFQDITHPEDLDSDLEQMRALLAGDIEQYSMEKRYLRKDGSPIWINLTGTLVRDEAGAPDYFIAVVEDIARRKAAETEILRLNTDLERQVRERTAQLLQLQKMEAIGRLTAGVAHDFNNVLQGLGNCLFVIDPYVPEGAPRNLLHAAQQSIGQGARLTQALLAFARRQALVPESIDLGDLFDEIGPLLERALGGQIHIEVDVPPNVPPALVDRAQLESAILNLAINARDAMASGGTLTVRAAAVRVGEGERGLPPELMVGEYVTISVADTGSGMDEATQARVFEPFFTTKAFGQGSGLGLAIVHGMAVQSGGAVSVRSAPDQGTTVTLYLPRAGPVVAQEAPPIVAMKPGVGRTVLIVDDNELVRRAMEMTLQGLGHRVLAAPDGAAALEILSGTEDIDGLITDYAMEDMNGVELIQKARSLRPHLPVMLITGYADLTEDMDDIAVLHKPFQAADLVSNLHTLLGASTGR